VPRVFLYNNIAMCVCVCTYMHVRVCSTRPFDASKRSDRNHLHFYGIFDKTRENGETRQQNGDIILLSYIA